MATRSNVGYVKANGSISAVYCHWDGYPEHMVSAIEGFISNFGVKKFMSEVRRAQRQAGLRSLDSNEFETYGDMRDERSEGDEYKETERDRLNNCYAYLVDSRTGKITEFYEHGQRLSLDTMRDRM